MTFRVFALVLFVCGTTKLSFGQGVTTRSRPKETAAPAVAGLSASSLKTDRLANKDIIDAVYRGDFDHVGLGRYSLETQALFTTFMDSFATLCPTYLPANKVPITEQYCVSTQYPVNRAGVRVGQDSCSGYARRAIPGEFAYPEDEKEAINLERNLQPTTLAGQIALLRELTNDGKENALQALAQKATEFRVHDPASDMNTLIKVNGCANPALNRFRQNMRFYIRSERRLELTDPDRVPDSPEAAAAFAQADACWSKTGNAHAPECIGLFRHYLELNPNGPESHYVRGMLAPRKTE